MTPARQTREFGPEDLDEAKLFVESLPENARVYVDEWVDNDWRFVFGDDRDHACSGLCRIKPGCRFRIRPIYLA